MYSSKYFAAASAGEVKTKFVITTSRLVRWSIAAITIIVIDQKFVIFVSKFVKNLLNF